MMRRAALRLAVASVVFLGVAPTAQAPQGPRHVGEASPPDKPLSLWYRNPLRIGHRRHLSPVPKPAPNGSGHCPSEMDVLAPWCSVA